MQRKTIPLALLVLLCFFLVSQKTAQAYTDLTIGIGTTYTFNPSTGNRNNNDIRGATITIYNHDGSAPYTAYTDYLLGLNVGAVDPALYMAGTATGDYSKGLICYENPNTDNGGLYTKLPITNCESNYPGITEQTGLGKTRIIDMQPATGSTTSTNLVSFYFKAAINQDDASRGIGVKIYLHNIDQNVLLAGALSPSDIVLYDAYTTTPGYFILATSTYIGSGNYRLYAKLSGTSGDFFGSPVVSGCSLIGGFLTLVCTDASTQFIVVAPTFIGNISQQSYAQMNTLFSSTSATSTANLSTSCNPISGFNVINCLAFLFIPDAGLISDSLANFRDNAATHFPLGYVTDFLTILSTTTNGTLTVLDVVVPPGIPGTGAHLQLSLAHQLDPLLNATTSQFNNVSASSTDSFLTITMYYWNLVVYVGTGLYLIGRILGSHIINI